MSCSRHQEGLEPSACTSPTLRKLSAGQPWSKVPPWRDKMVSALEQIGLVRDWEGAGVAPSCQAWAEEVAGKSGLTLPTAGVLRRLLGERKWGKGTETKS